MKNKIAYIIAATGGTLVNSDINFMMPWMKHFLNFIGIMNVDTIVADGIYTGDREKK